MKFSDMKKGQKFICSLGETWEKVTAFHAVKSCGFRMEISSHNRSFETCS